MSSRYDRQVIISGWKQEKLKNSRIAIVGADEIGFWAALPLTCLGVGEISIFDNSLIKLGRYLYNTNVKNPEATAIAEYLSKINPDSKIDGKKIKIDKFSIMNLAPYDIILDCENNQKTTEVLYNYVGKKNKHLISIRKSTGGGEVAIAPNKAESQISQKYDSATSMLLGGIAAEEIRKIINPLSEKEKIISEKIQYDQYDTRRFYTGERIDSRPSGDFNPNPISVVGIGCGGTGCYGAVGGFLMWIGTLTIYDFDKVENTNLNRQFLHYDSVGKYKIDSIVSKIGPISNGSFHGVNKRITEENINEIGKPDYIIDFVDNVETRAIINRYSLKHKIPYIKVGTTATDAEVIVCVPGKTPCLNCYTDVYEKAGLAPEHCNRNPNPSVVTCNQIAAGIALKELENLIRGNLPVFGKIKYYSNASERAFVSSTNLVECDCGYQGR